MSDTNYHPLVSVIVPVYNVEAYLDRCVNSITNQTYTNLEVILINDGSTDSSGLLCDQLSARDARIVVLHTQNSGPSAARNAALRIATGEYVTFVDADDYIGANHILSLLSTAIGADSPIAVTGVTGVYEDGVTPVTPPAVLPSEYALLPSIKAICIAVESVMRPFAEHPCGKIFSSSLIPQLFFPEGRLWEDQFVMYKVMFASETVAYENANDYFYVQQRASSNSQMRDERFLDTLDARKEILDFARTKSLPELEAVATKKYYGRLIGHFANLNLYGQEKLADRVYKDIVSERVFVLKSPYAPISTKIAMGLSFLPKKLFTFLLKNVEKHALSAGSTN